MPERIEPKFVERVWGSHDLAPWYARQAAKIGEVWFDAGSLLIKFLFTTENLSVQVHPEDDYARLHHNSNGKTEMWYILRAEPDAKIALGFRERYDRGAVSAAAESGEIMKMLDWVPARAGDVFFTPAGTVHALGAGLAVCEIQQTSDITYRLYDYGRGRELHLERGMEVSRIEPFVAQTVSPPALASCRYFQTERLEWSEPFQYEPLEKADETLMILTGSGTLDGRPYQPGEVYRAGRDAFPVTPATPCVVLRTYVP